MADFFSSFSSGLGNALSGALAGLIVNTLTDKNDNKKQAKDYYQERRDQEKRQEKRQAELRQFVDRANLAQDNLLTSINKSNDLLERKYDQTRKENLDSSKKRLATIRAYAGLHGTAGTNAIRNQLENVQDQNNDKISDLKYNIKHQIDANADKFKSFMANQKLDYKGLLL